MVVTRIRAGIITSDGLKKIAKVGRKYRVAMLKMTSGQRIALVGLELDTVPLVIGELGRLSQFQYLLEFEGETDF